MPYFEVYSRAIPVGLGPARALGAGASQGLRVHPRNKPDDLALLELNVYHILKFTFEPDPWSWGQPGPLGLGPARAQGCIPGINLKI